MHETSTSSASWFDDVMSELIAGRDLTPAAMRSAMQDIMSGGPSEIEVGVFLTALRMKGESVDEIATAAQVLRECMIPLETGSLDVLDTCGTGGDGTHTFNISTAAALVVAGAGVPVVKHGNRSVSSNSGSADVLRELGVFVEGDAVHARRCLDEAGMAFCFAPQFHPAMRQVAPVRRKLRFHTLFNCLGPLINPARASFHLLGVGRAGLLDLLSAALAKLGVRRALLVCGADGLDEVSLSALTHVRQVAGPAISSSSWTPDDFGLAPCRLSDLHIGSPAESAAVIESILAGAEGPCTRVVLANAAAALMAAEQVRTPREGVERARRAIELGRARQVLEGLRRCAKC